MATVQQLFAEAFRLRLMRGLENLFADAGYGLLAGADEVGRGALAGPVVAAAVIVDPRRLVPGVDDSKKLSAEDRECLAEGIRRASVACAVCEVPPEDIDSINILEASKRAIRRSLLALAPSPDCALVDAVALPEMPFPCVPLVKGDALSYAIAASSIVAKVHRDRYMCELARSYPQYGFESHKGYAARRHLEALQEFGPCPEHRLTFRSVLPQTHPVVH